MKPVITYYGGKQRIASKICEVIDTIPHLTYVEPFCGGAAVLFAKELYNKRNYREVLNDYDDRIITLYRVCQEQKEDLLHLLKHTPNSQEEYKRSLSILRNKEHFSKLWIAWAVVIQTKQSFAGGIGKGWQTARKGPNHSKIWKNHLNSLEQILDRLLDVYLSCEDALKCIKRWDSPNTLFYVDPPYVNTSQGHYKGYTVDNLQELCYTLDSVQGTFILSGYNSEIFPKTTKEVLTMRKIVRACKDSNSDVREEFLWIKG